MQIGGGALIGIFVSYLPDENQLYLSLISRTAKIATGFIK
jgi:hypothetical protein